MRYTLPTEQRCAHVRSDSANLGQCLRERGHGGEHSFEALDGGDRCSDRSCGFPPHDGEHSYRATFASAGASAGAYTTEAPPRKRGSTIRELARASLELVDVLGQWAAYLIRDLTREARRALEKERRT